AVLRLSRRDGIDLRAAAQRIADDPTVLDGLFDGSPLPSARATALQGAHHEH
ncbi:MAG: ornithine aminomutase, partial [Propionibacterium sp.]|nr:ornithine aminomutase [Propionibacterium sp.]